MNHDVILYQMPRFPSDPAHDVWTESHFALEVQALCRIEDETTPTIWRLVETGAAPVAWASVCGRAVPLPPPAWAPGKDWVDAWATSDDPVAMCGAVEGLVSPQLLVEAIATMAALALPWVAAGETRFSRALIAGRAWARGDARPGEFWEAFSAISHARSADPRESYAFAAAFQVLRSANAAELGQSMNTRGVPYALSQAVGVDCATMRRDCAAILRAVVSVREVYNALYAQVARERLPAIGDA